jgi:hypothetical protein
MQYNELTGNKLHGTLQDAINILLQDPAVDNLQYTSKQAIALLIGKAETKIARKKDLSNPFGIAAKFMAKDDVRYYLNFIYSTGEELHASDGNTAVIVKHAATPGFYTPSGNMAYPETFARFPSLKDAIKNLGVKKAETYDLTKPLEGTAENVKLGPTWFFRKYVERVIKLGITEAKINDAMLYAEKDNLQVVIMPTRV